MKKKALAVLLAAALGASILWRCGKGSDAGASAPPASTTAGSTGSSTASDTDSGIQPPDPTGHTLMIYCGAGMTKPFQGIADAFKNHTRCEMSVTYASAGQVRPQITASEKGDLLVTGSEDGLKPVGSYMEGKKELVRHMPVLAVQSGNPKNITGLADLTGGGVMLIMGDVGSTPTGKIAKKAMIDVGVFDQVQIRTITTTAPQTSTTLAARGADAAIVWKRNCDAQDVEIVNTADLDPYIKTISAASLSCAAGKDALEVFSQYLDVDTAREVWMKYGYEIVE